MSRSPLELVEARMRELRRAEAEAERVDRKARARRIRLELHAAQLEADRLSREASA